jgi:hypothetical protein
VTTFLRRLTTSTSTTTDTAIQLHQIDVGSGYLMPGLLALRGDDGERSFVRRFGCLLVRYEHDAAAGLWRLWHLPVARLPMDDDDGDDDDDGTSRAQRQWDSELTARASDEGGAALAEPSLFWTTTAMPVAPVLSRDSDGGESVAAVYLGYSKLRVSRGVPRSVASRHVSMLYLKADVGAPGDETPASDSLPRLALSNCVVVRDRAGRWDEQLVTSDELLRLLEAKFPELLP